jgi:anti-sigma regulatory factor (Ser/Thr protein kinase)
MIDRERLLGEVRQAAREREQAAKRERLLLRDVLESVTGGRLRLCHEPSELPRPLERCGEWVALSAPSDLWELRRRTELAAVEDGIAERRASDLVTAASEAAMNAVVHGGGGRGRICVTENTVQVWVEDSGDGIAVVSLPRATLERGYTTAGTLGHGMKIVLDTVDRVYLLTGEDGTTVVMEQDREEPPPAWLSASV